MTLSASPLLTGYSVLGECIPYLKLFAALSVSSRLFYPGDIVNALVSNLS